MLGRGNLKNTLDLIEMLLLLLTSVVQQLSKMDDGDGPVKDIYLSCRVQSAGLLFIKLTNK